MEGKPANADNPQSLFNSINPGGLDAPQLIIKSPTPQRLRYPTHFTMLLDTNEPPSYYAATQDQAPSTHGDAKYETMDELESVAPSYKDRAPSVAGTSVPYPIPIPRNYGSTPDDNDLPPPPAQADDEFYSAANRQVQPARPNRGHKFCIAGGLGMLITTTPMADAVKANGAGRTLRIGKATLSASWSARLPRLLESKSASSIGGRRRRPVLLNGQRRGKKRIFTGLSVGSADWPVGLGGDAETTAKCTDRKSVV